MIDFKRHRKDGKRDTINYPKDRLFGLKAKAMEQCEQFNLDNIDSDHESSDQDLEDDDEE